jgi:hypothetical protein
VNIIQGITDQPKQQMTLVLEDGTSAILLMTYRPNQLAWVYDLTYGELVINGQQLVASPNVIRQFRMRLPFGIACITAGNVEPVNLEDFVNGTAALYLLNSADVLDVEASVFPGL